MGYPDRSDLDSVNSRFNRLPYVADPKNFDDWSPIDESGGDCESYAVGKLRALVSLGWPIERLRLACCYVEPYQLKDATTGLVRWATMEERYHGVLDVKTDFGPRILDNRQDHPCTLGELYVLGYVPDRIQREGGSRDWAKWIWEDAPAA